MNEKPQPLFGDIISAYGREDAIADGMLIDVSTTAREAGIVYPVAVTAAVWQAYVAVPPRVECQDEAGRLWDVLWMLRCAIKGGKCGTQIDYTLHVRNDNRKPRLVRLKAICGPGDDMDPVITIMLPNED